jgi:L-ascorbate metabolism protein UlaG (beta-lactamase superfamily)
MEMVLRLTLLLMSAAMVAAPPQAQVPSTTRIPASGGEIVITALGHASVQLEQAGKVIIVDPVANQADLSQAKPADLILVTDIHADHLDPAAIAKLRKSRAPVVIPSEAMPKVPDGIVMRNREMLAGDLAPAGIPVIAVPAYNIQRGPAPDQLYHPKERGQGYLLTIGGKQLYVAGDTECVPAMAQWVRNVDVAFIPMNLPYTMPPSEAAECVKGFKPKIAIPYHFMGQKPEEFAEALKGESIEVRILNWYPNFKAGR